jgi:pyridoxal phosphate enzyme (YggS family)
MLSIKDNILKIQKRIDEACIKADRATDEVKILPVSKTKSIELIKKASLCGFKRFGENKVQEIVQKKADLKDFEFCLIGHLQTNKVNKVIKYVSEIHSLDSYKLALALEKALQKEGKSIDVLIQVNTSKESQKYGCDPKEVEDFVKKLKQFSCLSVKGFMTIAKNSTDTNEVRSCFKHLKTLQQKMLDSHSDRFLFPTLSMGMSNDLEIAIQEGSTEIRVGSSIFGMRV